MISWVFLRSVWWPNRVKKKRGECESVGVYRDDGTV